MKTHDDMQTRVERLAWMHGHVAGRISEAQERMAFIEEALRLVDAGHEPNAALHVVKRLLETEQRIMTHFIKTLSGEGNV